MNIHLCIVDAILLPCRHPHSHVVHCCGVLGRSVPVMLFATFKAVFVFECEKYRGYNTVRSQEIFVNSYRKFVYKKGIENYP